MLAFGLVGVKARGTEARGCSDLRVGSDVGGAGSESACCSSVCRAGRPLRGRGKGVGPRVRSAPDGVHRGLRSQKHPGLPMEQQ